jgi:hypothetical protein
LRSNRVSLTLFVLLCGIVSFIACSKYKDTNPPSTDLPADKPVIATIQGRVLDENGVPVMSAVVRGGGKDTTTDVNGGFLFNNIQVSSRFGYVKVQKPGYFTAGRSVITNAGGTNYVTISLIPRTSKGSFTAASGGTIVVQAGDTVVFDPASVVNDATKAAYTGTVHVYAAYLDPTDINLPRTMPGDLRGIGKDGKETALQTFGMMVVELEGDAGEKLQLAAGKTAALTMAIPASMQATTPASMPLWYFNDTTGKWIEQGTATRKGNSLCGTTSHFTFWNCDAPMSVVNFKVRIIDQHGNPVAHQFLQFVSPTLGAAGGYTDLTGLAQGLIPKGQTLLFQVINPCGSMIFGENIGPVLADQDLGTLTVNIETTALTFTGTVVDCSNKPVANGWVNVLLDGLNYRASVTNGAFALPIIRCSGSTSQAQITAGDYGAQQAGKATSVSVKTGSMDLGQLSACGNDFDQTVDITINGTNYFWSVLPDNISYYSTAIEAYSTVTRSQVSMYLSAPMTGIGAFDLAGFGVYGPNIQINQIPPNDIVHFTITGYGPVNGYVTGTLSGNVFDSVAQKSYPITGSLKVKRTQ